MPASYKSLLFFLAGLIVTAVALVVGAFSALPDAWPVAAWKEPLLSFLAWMSCVIVVATIAAFWLQMRVIARSAVAGAKPEDWEKVLAFLPILPGLAAAWQMIKLGWISQGVALF